MIQHVRVLLVYVVFRMYHMWMDWLQLYFCSVPEFLRPHKKLQFHTGLYPENKVLKLQMLFITVIHFTKNICSTFCYAKRVKDY